MTDSSIVLCCVVLTYFHRLLSSRSIYVYARLEVAEHSESDRDRPLNFQTRRVRREKIHDGTCVCASVSACVCVGLCVF